MPLNFQKHNSLFHFYPDGLENRNKIAGFDIDGTIIQPASGKKFAESADDWEFVFDNIPDKLQELYDQGYQIVFLTNQMGITKGKVTEAELVDKFNQVVSELDLPVIILAATRDNHHRKPGVGMWNFLERTYGQALLAESFYVGDAAGRKKGWKSGAKKDHSDSDRKFALNVGLEFYTPEEFFLDDARADFQLGGFDPTQVQAGERSPTNGSSSDQEMIINIGYPGSGKTTFTKKHLSDYQHVNMDTLRTQAKCISRVKQAMKDGQSVVVDNTNPDLATRKKYLDLAKKHGVPVRAFHFTADMELAQHNAWFRCQETEGQIKQIPKVVYYTYRKKFVEPSLGEGFSEIVNLDFLPEFEDDEVGQRWRMYSS